MSRAPWRDALDGKIALMRYVRSNEFERVYSITGSLTEHLQQVKQVMVISIPDSEPIWVAKDISQHLTNNLCAQTEAFDAVHSRIPTEGIVWLEEPLMTYLGKDVLRTPIHLRAITYSVGVSQRERTTFTLICGWHIRPDGAMLCVPIDFVQQGVVISDWIDAHSQRMKGSPYRRGSSASSPEEISNAAFGTVVRYLNTLFTFMKQEIVLATPQPVDRNGQREAARLAMPSDVRVVTWRQAKYQRTTDPQPVEWSCHWSSKAHTRTLRSGKIVPVRGCIKGNRDKPYKPPTPVVHSVNR